MKAKRTFTEDEVCTHHYVAYENHCISMVKLSFQGRVMDVLGITDLHIQPDHVLAFIQILLNAFTRVNYDFPFPHSARSAVNKINSRIAVSLSKLPVQSLRARTFGCIVHALNGTVSLP